MRALRGRQGGVCPAAAAMSAEEAEEAERAMADKAAEFREKGGKIYLEEGE